MNRLNALLLGIVFQIIFSSLTVASEMPKVKITGIYSSLAFNKESGDVLGEEIVIGISREGYFVVFQTSEGDPAMPVVVQAKINEDHIIFTLPSPMAKWGDFMGQISSEGLVGKFQKSGQILHLKRKNSYWQ